MALSSNVRFVLCRAAPEHKVTSWLALYIATAQDVLKDAYAPSAQHNIQKMVGRYQHSTAKFLNDQILYSNDNGSSMRPSLNSLQTKHFTAKQLLNSRNACP